MRGWQPAECTRGGLNGGRHPRSQVGRQGLKCSQPRTEAATGLHLHRRQAQVPAKLGNLGGALLLAHLGRQQRLRALAWEQRLKCSPPMPPRRSGLTLPVQTRSWKPVDANTAKQGILCPACVQNVWVGPPPPPVCQTPPQAANPSLTRCDWATSPLSISQQAGSSNYTARAARKTQSAVSDTRPASRPSHTDAQSS